MKKVAFGTMIFVVLITIIGTLLGLYFGVWRYKGISGGPGTEIYPSGDTDQTPAPTPDDEDKDVDYLPPLIPGTPAQKTTYYSIEEVEALVQSANNNKTAYINTEVMKARNLVFNFSSEMSKVNVYPLKMKLVIGQDIESLTIVGVNDPGMRVALSDMSIVIAKRETPFSLILDSVSLRVNASILTTTQQQITIKSINEECSIMGENNVTAIDIPNLKLVLESELQIYGGNGTESSIGSLPNGNCGGSAIISSTVDVSGERLYVRGGKGGEGIIGVYFYIIKIDSGNGGNGGDSIKCQSLTSSASIVAVGGNGGNGANGSDGNVGYVGYTKVNIISGGKDGTKNYGGNGGRGTNGGNGGWYGKLQVARENISLTGGATIKSTRGESGKGGNGGNGGNGGKGGNFYNVVGSVWQCCGGSGGNGGNGGNGSTAGDQGQGGNVGERGSGCPVNGIGLGINYNRTFYDNENNAQGGESGISGQTYSYTDDKVITITA